MSECTSNPYMPACNTSCGNAAGYPEITETYVIDTPQLGGRRYLTFANLASTITKVVILHEGASAESQISIAHGSNYQGVDTEIFASPVTSTSRTVGDHYTVFVVDSATVAAASHIWATVWGASTPTTKIIINITRLVEPASLAGSLVIPVQDSGAGQAYLPLVEAP